MLPLCWDNLIGGQVARASVRKGSEDSSKTTNSTNWEDQARMLQGLAHPPCSNCPILNSIGRGVYIEPIRQSHFGHNPDLYSCRQLQSEIV